MCVRKQRWVSHPSEESCDVATTQGLTHRPLEKKRLALLDQLSFLDSTTPTTKWTCTLVICYFIRILVILEVHLVITIQSV
jgi:hypothetical protein